MADRINKSILLNSASAGEEEMVKMTNKNPRATDLNVSRNSSAELPKGARSLSKQRKTRTTSQIQNIRDDHIVIEEQSTPIREFHVRKGSRLTEPPFPEPVDEAKQRFSTPRH